MILGLLLAVSTATAQSMEDWAFPDDDLEARIAEVSDGELTLLDTEPDHPAHHHRNTIRISQRSLESGWVVLEQCHSDLDPVGALEIVYHPERIRQIHLLSTKNIAQARVEGPTVQLQGIEPSARLCLRAESRALAVLEDGRYQLRNGPFMRRFLDGYYPMRVSLEIRYPADLIKLASAKPLPGKAGSMQQTPGRIAWDSWFKGRLFTEFEFQRVQP